jgi:hypothetical protein
VGPLGHPRGALAALADARIDVTAIDAYWWYPLQRHDATLAARFAPSARLRRADAAARVRCAFPRIGAAPDLGLLVLGEEPEAKPHLDALGIRCFAAVIRARTTRRPPNFHSWFVCSPSIVFVICALIRSRIRVAALS